MPTTLPIVPLDVRGDPALARRWALLTTRVYAMPRPTPEFVEQRVARFGDQRLAGAFDGEDLVAAFRSSDTTLSVPGGALVPANAVAGVVVASTHRRQGLLSRWMADDALAARERGCVASALFASEAAIYGRFGFGAASGQAVVSIDPARAAYRRPGWGTIAEVEPEAALVVGRRIYPAAQHANPGSITRPEHYWQHVLGTNDAELSGATHWTAVHLDDAGQPDGLIAYTNGDTSRGGAATGKVEVLELLATSPRAEVELWRYVCGLDFVTEVTRDDSPADVHLPGELWDARAVRRSALWDGVWVRIDNLKAALAARTYAVPGAWVIEVPDAADGPRTVRLEVDESGTASCTATTAEPDLRLGIAELSTLWLGGATGIPDLGELANAGRATVRDPATLPRLAATFRWPIPARSLTYF